MFVEKTQINIGEHRWREKEEEEEEKKEEEEEEKE